MEVQEEISAIVVIYDHDNSLTKQHSEGARRRRSFEKPSYEANLRVLPFLRSHIQTIRTCKKKKVFVAAATLGEFEERVIESWKSLGVERKDLFLCAKFIDELRLKTEGKSFHIVNILLQIYLLYPHVKIEHVYVVDDSVVVLNALALYSEYISKDPWKDDLRLNVPITGIRVPVPELEYEMIEVEGKLPRAILKMQRDDLLQADVCVELLHSERRFIAVLKAIEAKIDPAKDLGFQENKSTHFQSQRSLSRSKEKSLNRSQDRVPLDCTDVAEKLRDISNSGDSIDNSSCFSTSDVEGSAENEISI